MSKKDFNVVSIPLANIFIDKDQPRKHYNDDNLKELAASIETHGVISPIMVREVPDDHTKFIIIFGERRFVASQIARQKTIPCMISDMTAESVLETQLIENLQREDVHPMQEAIAIHKLSADKKMTELQFAKSIGKSIYFIRQRVKLASLTEDFQTLYLSNKTDLDSALWISTLSHAAQTELFKRNCKNHADDDFHFQLNDWTYKQYLGDLNDAPFDITDATLVPAMGACTTCQFNSSCSQLFPDEVSSPTCRKLECYQNKQEIMFTRNLEIAKQDPSCLYLSKSHGDATAKKTLSETHNVTVIDLYDCTVEDYPDAPDADDYEGDEDPEENKKAYDAAVDEWKTECAEWEESVKKNKWRKALVLTGTEKGKFVYLTLKSKGKSIPGVNGTTVNETDALIATLNETIADIQAKEKRAKELDFEKVQKRIIDDLGEIDFISDKVSKKSDLFMKFFIWESIQYQMRDKTTKTLGLKPMHEYKDFDSFEKALNALKPNQVQALIRFATFSKCKQYMGETQIYSKLLRTLATDIGTIPVDAYVTEQNDKSVKREANVNAKIKELKKQITELAPPVEKKKSSSKTAKSK